MQTKDDKVMGLIMSDVKNGYIKGITFDRLDEYGG